MRRSKSENRYKLKSFLIIIVWIFSCTPAFGLSEANDTTTQSTKEKTEPNTQSPVWQVGILKAPPFSFKDSNGEWVGICVILWKLVADDIGLNYNFEELGLSELLEGVSHGDLDAGIGPITINAEREKLFDFTHSFFSTGLGVVVKKESNTTIVSISGTS